MPEIGTKVQEGDNVKQDVAYEITFVDADVVTDVRSLSGVRVDLLTQKAEEGSVMLWKRAVTGPRSKLGAFITVLGSNTDKWLHKWIIFRHWGKQDNLIEKVEAPVERATKATTAKSISKAIKES